MGDKLSSDPQVIKFYPVCLEARLRTDETKSSEMPIERGNLGVSSTNYFKALNSKVYLHVQY